MADRRRGGSSSSDAAACLESRRGEILARYERQLEQRHSSLAANRHARWQVLAQAEEALDEMISALKSGHEVSDEGSRLLPRHIGAPPAARGTHPAESLRAAAELFKIITVAAADCAAADADALILAVLALNQSMSLRIRESVISYHGFLLDKVHQAHMDERRHLARELHDRVGAGVSIAHRQLELHELSKADDPVAARQRIELAQQELINAMNDIRQLTSDLRLSEPFKGLEKNLRSFVGSAGSDGVAAEVIVNGDEAWMKPDILDEVFLTVREAVRNALQHSHARAILVRIDIAPHELRATVDDNGVGFDMAALSGAAGGTGIPSMRERVLLLGGTITLSSLAGQGTKVEIHIPRPDAQEVTSPG